MIHPFSSTTKYYERPFVSCVSHQHFKYKRNFRYCTGESIITPHKLNTVIEHSTGDLWKTYLNNPPLSQQALRLAKIPYKKPWPLEPNITSTHFYVIGLPEMFTDLSNALTDKDRDQAITLWLDKYIDTQYVISVPIFTDLRDPNESWYVSNQRTLSTFKEERLEEPYMILFRRCYTLGSAWLLLFALVNLNKLSPYFVASLMEQGRTTYVNISDSMRYFYLGLGIPMACDITDTICKSWFKPEIYELFFSRRYTYYMEWLYMNEDAFIMFYSTLQSIDQNPIRDIIKTILKTNVSGNNELYYYPWLYPFLAKLVNCSKKEWRYWIQESKNIFHALQMTYFKKKSALSHLFYTISHCLIYLYNDMSSKHRVIKLWNQLIDYCQNLPLTKYFTKILIHFYKSPYLVSVPIYFMKSIPLFSELFIPTELEPSETLYQIIKRASPIDPHATYYLHYLDKRAITKLHAFKNMDSYLVGSLMHNYFKEHRAELFS